MAKVLKLDAALQHLQPAGLAPAPPAPMAVARQPRHRQPLVHYSLALVPDGLPPSVQSAALLLCAPDRKPVRQLATDDLIEELLDVVALVPFLLGHSNTLMAGKDLAMMCTAVAEMVQRDFPGLSVPEVATALRRGCSGEWKKPDERLLASLPTIRSWCKAYTEGSRSQALKALQQASDRQQDLLALPVHNPALDYPRQVAAGMANIKAVGHLPALLDSGGVFYAWLKKIGAFRGFGNPRQVLIKECLLLTRHRPLDVPHRSFAELLRTGWPASHELAGKVLQACQKRTLAGWIRYHNARGTDMLAWLTQLATDGPNVGTAEQNGRKVRRKRRNRTPKPPKRA